MQAGVAVRHTVDVDGGVRKHPEGAEEAVRAHTYSLLAALLSRCPGADLLAVLGAVEVPDAAPDGTPDPQFADSWRVLAMAAERADTAALDDEYHALFIGLGRGEVMPYGSWYLTGFLMDRPLAVLRGDLTALGIERRGDVREPEDHVAALLETMAILCSSGADHSAQRRFFQAHLEPWMPAFFEDLQRAKTAEFYRAVGRFAAEFVAFESRYLAMTV